MCLKDLEDAASVPHKDSQKIIDWVRNDHLQRFQLTSELGRVEGKPGLHPSWFIRAKKGHTIPVSLVGCVRSTLLPSLGRV